MITSEQLKEYRKFAFELRSIGLDLSPPTSTEIHAADIIDELLNEIERRENEKQKLRWPGSVDY